jgi:hypothetical protein
MTSEPNQRDELLGLFVPKVVDFGFNTSPGNISCSLHPTSANKTVELMASSTTASQAELKAYRVPLGWRDSCSACVFAE